MTTKRFTHKEDDWEILDNEKHLAYAHSGYQADKICKLLNEQHKEIEHLKTVIKDVEYQRDYVHPKYDECRKCVKELFKKNERLKQQIKDLRIGVLDSIHEADEIQCTCNPCVVEECVKRVVE